MTLSSGDSVQIYCSVAGRLTGLIEYEDVTTDGLSSTFRGSVSFDLVTSGASTVLNGPAVGLVRKITSLVARNASTSEQSVYIQLTQSGIAVQVGESYSLAAGQAAQYDLASGVLTSTSEAGPDPFDDTDLLREVAALGRTMSEVLSELVLIRNILGG